MQTQDEYWNGPTGERWAKYREKIDRSFASITEAWLAAVDPRPSDRALDIGCGAGETTRLLRARAKSALGIDISAPMLAVARCLGGEFLEADAATHPFEPTFDCIASRFGVMFFDDPITAFINIRRAFAPDARLSFTSWRPATENPWATAPLAWAADLLPPVAPVDPTVPGPFAFSDPERIREVLSRAGYREISVEPCNSKMHLGATTEDAVEHCTNIGPLARALGELGEDVRSRVRERIGAFIAREGTTFGAAIWIAKAR